MNMNSYKELLTFIKNISSPKFDKFLSDIDNQSEKVVMDLANSGWFIWLGDGDLSALAEKYQALFNSNSTTQNQFMINHISTNISYIKKELVTNYPNRESQIRDAFEAHTKNLFFSSVPSFLILAEAIGWEIFPEARHGLYAKYPQHDKHKAGIPRYDDLFDHLTLEVFEDSWLKPIRACTNLTDKSAAKDKTIIHRHSILHGNSDTYGSLTNSLKSISLLYYIHRALTHIKSYG